MHKSTWHHRHNKVILWTQT